MSASRPLLEKPGGASVGDGARGTLYLKGKQAGKDKAVATAIAQWYEQDDTMGHRKLAALLKTGRNRVKRVIKKYDIAARRKKETVCVSRQNEQRCPKYAARREEPADSRSSFLISLKCSWLIEPKSEGALPSENEHDTSWRSRLTIDASDLVVSTIEWSPLSVPGTIWHSDQGSQYGAEQTRNALLRKGFERSMSRAGTPTDNGYAERFVGQFKLSVAESRSDRTVGEFLRAAEDWINFDNRLRPHEGIDHSYQITMRVSMACRLLRFTLI